MQLQSLLTQNREDDLENELDDNDEEHEPGDKVLAGPLDDAEEGSEEGEANDRGENVRLDVVGHPGLEGRLVEAVLLLKDKGLVVRPREVEREREDGQEGDPDERVGDLSLAVVSKVRA